MAKDQHGPGRRIKRAGGGVALNGRGEAAVLVQLDSRRFQVGGQLGFLVLDLVAPLLPFSKRMIRLVVIAGKVNKANHFTVLPANQSSLESKLHQDLLHGRKKALPWHGC
jgi:hypothetical protein